MRRVRPGARASLIAAAVLAGCTSQNARDRFLLAEKMWQEKNYPAAVVEYEKVIQKDPTGELGIKASFRAGMTQTLFLNEHLAALRKLNRIIEVNPEDPLAHEAYRQIGEILFTRLEQYGQAADHYAKMLELYPTDPARDEYLFRIGKSEFHLFRFDDAIRTFRSTSEKFPGSPWGRRARFEVGVCLQTKAHQLQQSEGKLAAEAFRQAVAEFQAFVKLYPNDPLALEARFELGNGYEELDQIDAAATAFEEIRELYPNRSVIEMKLKRIQSRRRQKKL